jgi:hypothetical protein
MRTVKDPTGLPNERPSRPSPAVLRPPCEIHVSMAFREPLTIPVDVELTGGEWKVSKNPIKLENDDDVVCWNLDALIVAFGSLHNVKAIFTQGPSGFDPKLGPFAALPVFSTSNGTASLTATGRNNLYGDCYCYNLWVHRADDPHDLHVESLFPIDPQVDNLMPPPPPPSPLT